MTESRKAYQQRYREQYKSQIKRVNLTLSKDEYRAFSRVAGNRKVTAFIKELALSALAGKAHMPASLEEELRTLRFAIRNIANNVNQMAHYSHTVRGMTAADENNLLQYLKHMEEAIQSYTEGRILESGHDH